MYHSVMKMCVGMEVQIHTFLTSVSYCGGCSASGPRYFKPEEIIPDNSWVSGWVGLRVGLVEGTDLCTGNRTSIHRPDPSLFTGL